MNLIKAMATVAGLTGLSRIFGFTRDILMAAILGAGPIADVLATLGDVPVAILIGPEGGFSDRERKRLAGFEAAHAVALGPRILRADTAAVAAMTLWQTALGDW